MANEVEYFYSKPFGFQRVEKKKESEQIDLGHRHYVNKGGASIPPNYQVTSLLNPPGSTALFDDSFPEYVGHVSIAVLSGRGRGVIATRDISAGDLLMASRAIAIVFPDDASGNSAKLWREVRKLGALREAIGEVIRQDPSTAPLIYDLYAGPHLGYLESPSAPEPPDMDRIERLCSFNAFQGAVQGYSSESSFGLWYFPSFLNHDCLGANARWTVVKNFMFVRAYKEIRKGEEVLISYVDPNESYAFRRNFFLKHEFQCACALCSLERSEGQTVRRRRDILLDDFRGIQGRDEDLGNFESIELILRELESLRPSHRHLNVFLIQPLLHAGFCRYEKRRYEEAEHYFKKAFDLCSLLGQLCLLCVSCSFTIATCLLRRGQRAEASHWVGVAKEWTHRTYGTSENQLIEILRPSFFNEMSQNGLM